MSIFKVIILAIVQGLAELLPVSSSAHVVVAEKLMGLDASSPQMTLMLVMLHTGTMFAVIAYFWNQWKKTYFSSGDAFKRFLVRLIWASVLTADYRRSHCQGDREDCVQGSCEGRDRGAVWATGPDRSGARGGWSPDPARGADGEAAHGRSRKRLRRQRNHAAGGLDRRDPGTVPAIPRIFAVGSDDLDRHVDRCQQRARRAVQLCAGRGADPASGGTRGPATGEGVA